jgi:2-polyprenyl-3-methyl-5-hydroxy-6-metoxy-1,4-benzoquinol methylase
MRVKGYHGAAVCQAGVAAASVRAGAAALTGGSGGLIWLVVSQPEFRELVRRIWSEVSASPAPARFVNAEGGSVEQTRNSALLFHHCANYAAALSLFMTEGRPLRLLELGCGSGALSRAFAAVMPGVWQLVATDYAPALLARAREACRLPNLSFERLDARELEPGRLAGFDGVFFLEVIEHLPRAEAARLLSRLHGAMRPGAVLAFSTLDRAAFSRPRSGYPPHCFEYTSATMAAFLRSHSPFGRRDILRLVSARIAAEHARAEDCGGYLANRLRGLGAAVTAGYPAVRRLGGLLTGVGFGLYSLLPRNGRFDLHGYLRTLEFAAGDPERPNPDSFGLVVRLQKV